MPLCAPALADLAAPLPANTVSSATATRAVESDSFLVNKMLLLSGRGRAACTLMERWTPELKT